MSELADGIGPVILITHNSKVMSIVVYDTAQIQNLYSYRVNTSNNFLDFDYWQIFYNIIMC